MCGPGHGLEGTNICLAKYLNKPNPCSKALKNMPYPTVSVVSICSAEAINVTAWEIVTD